ncbi:MAG: ATP-dependent RNA helicase DbpA [Fluviicoccus sp.]|uniref:ATP-dependent RNA helicase DbpA n=1 Tax=Fluviicoccus sp. TaxID=2003552 RepID=UPI0027241444|nr:ATP-dependent RNA helicase DbpA [Fluviicoccus sp.]MDO8330735.1 ATP-dependent RNA helicase DbpA [Fluviicoccus sp.]
MLAFDIRRACPSSYVNTDFASLPLSPALLDNLKSLDFTAMTPIQAQSLPDILQGRDVIAKAKTGSGKTAAFGLGILSKLNPASFNVQAVVLCPTRELADQVGKDIRRLARTLPNIKLITLCGGTALGPQIGSLEYGAHIVVGTPGRIQKHLDMGTLRLERMQTLVLDEADRMLDMGFEEAIKDVIKHMPANRQTLLFSATYPDSILKMSKSVQRNPLEVTVEAQHHDSALEQLFFEINPEQRLDALSRLLRHYRPESAVVFCNTKADCQDVVDMLIDQGFSALDLHGDLEQKDRDLVLVRFSNKSVSVLVATDVAARGLDIKDLSAVINYEPAWDAEVHVHRVGRTGRAGQKGLALTLFAPREAGRVGAVEVYQKAPITLKNLEELDHGNDKPLPSPMVTLVIQGGRKDKIRAGDILGALTGEAGIPGSEVGKIDIADMVSYVAIRRSSAAKALNQLRNGNIKGRSFRVRQI